MGCAGDVPAARLVVADPPIKGRIGSAIDEALLWIIDGGGHLGGATPQGGIDSGVEGSD